MSYVLYYSPGACSLAVHATLRAIGAPFELVRTSLQKAEHRKPEYLARNPLGQVPVLLDGDHTLKESAAILLYLLRKHPHGLLDDARYQAILEWLLFANSSLHQTYSAYFMLSRRIKDEQAKELAIDAVVARLNQLWEHVESSLKGPFLCGEEPSVADILVAVIAGWSGMLTKPVILGPRTRALCEAVAALPYVAEAYAAEGVSYKLPESV
jgi:glutathione S-transferase